MRLGEARVPRPLRPSTTPGAPGFFSRACARTRTEDGSGCHGPSGTQLHHGAAAGAKRRGSSPRLSGPKLLPKCRGTSSRFNSWPSRSPAADLRQAAYPSCSCCLMCPMEGVIPHSGVVSRFRQENVGTLFGGALRTEAALCTGQLPSLNCKRRHACVGGGGACTHLRRRMPRMSRENRKFPQSWSAAALSPS